MKSLVESLLKWYQQNARQLPWRGSNDPYVVWISEIMLQQTRVDAVIPYYLTWMERFPTIRDVVESTEQDLLRVWEGLGYYTRARNIHQAARVIMKEYDGIFPADNKKLQQLPGIGRYTAAMIASLAFGLDVPAVDGNIKRVYSRVMNIEIPVDSPRGDKQVWKVAEDYLPAGHAGDYNQALMDLSSAVCLPKNPHCEDCPLAPYCMSYAAGVQRLRPVRKPGKVIPHHIVAAAVIEQDGFLLLAKRPSKGLLAGLWEFPGGKVEDGETLEEALQRELNEELAVSVKVGAGLGVFHHAYTHFRITVHVFHCSLDGGKPTPVEAEQITWVTPSHLTNYPMGKVDRLIANRLMDNDGRS